MSGPLKVHIRYMILRDRPEVLAIDAHSFAQPVGEAGLREMLRRPNCIGMVAELGDVPIGWMAYELSKNHLRVLALAVHRDFRRRGVGTALVGKLKGKLSAGRRTRLLLAAPDSALGAHLFLRAQGARAFNVLRGGDGERDIYDFAYDLPAAVPAGVA
jgi:ribosomal-protein-alanine N-acetyltransferase